MRRKESEIDLMARHQDRLRRYMCMTNTYNAAQNLFTAHCTDTVNL